MKFRKNLSILAIVYFVALAGLTVFQRHVLYVPHHAYITPQKAGADPAFRELRVTSEDGGELTGWYAPPTGKKQTLVFFHGNADSLSSSVHIATPYLRAGYGFMIVEYRGYSDMRGSPSEQGLYADARAFIKSLLAGGQQGEHLILFGHSLGTGVATQMATEFRVGGVILLAPYLSIPKMAQIRFPIFPVQALVWDRFESDKKIANIHTPLLVMHGDADFVIPPSQGQKLFDLANQPKTFFSIPNRGHTNLFNDIVPLCLKWLEEKRTASVPEKTPVN